MWACQRCTTGPVGCKPAQRGSRAAGEGLFRNREMRDLEYVWEAE